MPILHSVLHPTSGLQGGKPVIVSPQAALVHRGPCVPIIVKLPPALVAELTKQGKPIPQPISGLALIDTGAGPTSIDEDAAQKLGLPVVDIVKLSSASHASTDAHVYPAGLEIQGLPIPINLPRAIGAPLAAQGLLVLIGRDLLSSCVFIYNGAAGEFTLTL